MDYEATILAVARSLDDVATEVDTWFDKPVELRAYKPASGGWSVDEVLEHISLTNSFLLLTCRKHTSIAIHRFNRGDRVPRGESDLRSLQVIGHLGSFVWARPEHMEPKGEVSSAEVRTTLRDQWRDCHTLLTDLKGGIGALSKITMTVNSLGKIDLYQWLYFLTMHAHRHVEQMNRIAQEYGLH